MKKTLTLLSLFTSILSFAQNKTNVVLIGIYHFNNPGFDQSKVKDRDILTEANQAALERISNKLLKKYKPNKVFVEYSYAKRANLNQMYSLYKNGKPYYSLDTLKNIFLKRFYPENEIFQLGFRLARKAGNEAIYAMDFDEVPIRFDLIKSKLAKNSSLNYKDYEKKLAEMSNSFNLALEKNSLEEVLKDLNTAEQYRRNKGLYISFLNRISEIPDFFGAELVANWYKRNLIMYGNIQNQVAETDQNIVVIAGVGHGAIMEELIKNDDRFNLIKISQIL